MVRKNKKQDDDEGLFGSRTLIFFCVTVIIYIFIKDINITGKLEDMLHGSVKTGTVTHSIIETLRSYSTVANALSASIVGLYVAYMPVSFFKKFEY